MLMKKRTWIFRWESKDAHYPGYYYKSTTRVPQLWMVLNRFNNQCWCNKPKNEWEKGRRKHCSERCSLIWAYGMRASWGILRDTIVREAGNKCELCSSEKGTMEVDHIEARCLGGDPWGSWNLRSLCHKCHAEKTKQDMAKLRTLKAKNKIRDSDIIPLTNF